MRCVLIPILVLAVLLPVAESIKCHYCESDQSDFRCFYAREEKECYEQGYKCGKIMYRISGKSYFKRGCVLKAYCMDQDAYCRANPGRSNCEVYCCDSKFCNSAPPSKTASVTLFVLASAMACLFVRNI
ncbi:predicted protein [Nematostella vectensis]|uniref:Uncharacterized protein n=1 Tax=Nematostella vectensis TaxID=45351 RepID=A7SMG6_NEMVE|nr:uncharacterized protein LOC5506518 [Nematostella vectensis]EDO35127.1 predicted protein [Nematostella vectensis]|eukprot:XP_001627227.1 predicted protein [Nematostella vectensis]